MEGIFNKPETPTPTPTPNTSGEFQNIEEYSIDNESKLKISFDDKLISFAVIKSSFPPKDYQSILSLEELYKVKKTFQTFKNTKDLVNWIINSFKQKTASIKFIDNKCILQVINPVLGEQFKINLNQIQNETYPSITDLEKNTIESNNKNNYFETLIKEQNKKINS